MGFRDPITDVATGADVTALEAITNAVKAKTDNLPAAPANEAGKVSTVDSRVTGAAALEATAQSIKTKTDLIGASVATAPSYRLKAATADGYQTYPALANAVSVVAGGAAWTWGSWAEIVAALPWEAYVVGLMIHAPGSGSNDPATVAIGAGAAASEVVKAVIPFELRTDAGLLHAVMLPIPILVANGARLAARSADSDGFTTYKVKLIVVRASDLEAF